MNEPAGRSALKLDLLSVLIVEDGTFIRNVLTGVLRTLGVGQVYGAGSGVEAVRFLEERRAALPRGTAPVDLLITDLVMPDVDGLMLLRWIRSSPRSPDKFLPVLMLSGAADRHYVEQARDLGATDFIAKPFSARTVGARLMQALARPRRFVLCNGYFGPDRRRTVKPVQMDCRMTTPEEVLVVHSQSKAVGIDRYPVVIFDLPNRLGAKVGIAPKGPVPSLPEDVLAAAEAEIQERAGDYAVWISEEVETLIRRIDRLPQEPEQVPAIMGMIHRAAHEMRGQGGIFGYPLITHVAKSLYEATSGEFPVITSNEHRLFKAHADAIRAVMNGRISGDGGATGQQLLASLEVAKKKYAKAGG
ncbi:response regulator [Azospirillum sp. RWY-5-1]|uniref:Response regulator n=1 Tax=Azospirillum oleiclasticum TaxID=2735135 RepID=A0ABX2T2R4_9PROT|nr:response regulator [Azospirillum oleiclasticum]NYZ11245.1 response regulator [Azospirillum oleiclasticum]NYZ18406.1 response regulator [Azospirillum oleiclasticum]